MWSDTRELLEAIYDTHAKLAAGEISNEDAHSQCRLYNSATKLLTVDLEHARATRRLKEGASGMAGVGLPKAKKR